MGRRTLNMADVFPRNNLNPDAVKWGRGIENVTRAQSYEISRAGQSQLMNNRKNANTFSTLGIQAEKLEAQVTELLSRSSHTLSLGTWTTPVSIPAFPGTGRRTVTRTISLPPPYDGQPRSATVFISGVGQGNPPGLWYVTIGAMGLTSKTTTEATITSQQTGVNLIVFLSGQTSFTLTMEVAGGNTPGGSATNATIGMNNLSVVATYGERV